MNVNLVLNNFSSQFFEIRLNSSGILQKFRPEIPVGKVTESNFFLNSREIFGGKHICKFWID